MDPRFQQKILQNYDFFQKKLRYLKSKFSTKVHRLLFLFNFFTLLEFCFLYHLSKVVQKLWNFLQCFIRRIRNLINEFWKFLEVLLQNYRYVKYFFFKILRFTIYFFIIIFDIFFLFRLPVLVKKFWKFLSFFILLIRDFIKDFWKIMERFSKKYTFEIQNSSKIQLFTICVFYFFSIFGIFFPDHLIKLVKIF